MACKSHDSSEIENNQTDKTHSSARRKVLKAALTGGALTAAHVLPGNWITPVVDFITVPAHAETSVPPTTTPSSPTPTTTRPLPCVCSLSGIGINIFNNTFDATLAWQNCSSAAGWLLTITGPQVNFSSGDPAGPTGNITFPPTDPGGGNTFQPNSTYIFTLTLQAGNNVFSTCTGTVLTPPRIN